MDTPSWTSALTAKLVLAGGVCSCTFGLLAWLLYGLSSGLIVGCLGAVYVTCGVLLNRMGPALPSWTLIGAGALASVEGVNIAVEHVGSLASAAIIGAATMGALVLAASWASVAGTAGRRLGAGVAAAVAVVGVGLLASTSVVLASAFIARVVAGEVRTDSLAGTLANARLHLLLPVLVAATVGTVSELTTRALHPLGRPVLAALSVGAAILIVLGVELLVRASSLPRTQRPGWVIPGMAAAALGLTLLPSGLRGAVIRKRAA